jgi:hypothetical protein
VNDSESSIEQGAASPERVEAPGGPVPFAVEPDAPRTGRLFFQIGVLVLVLTVVLLGLWEYFQVGTVAEIYRKELSVPSRELAEMVARDEGRLTQYDVLDAKAGAYQIPIRRAMQLLIDDPGRLEPLAPASRPAGSAGRSP